jgi:hypothetical protein
MTAGSRVANYSRRHEFGVMVAEVVRVAAFEGWVPNRASLTG